MKKGWRSFFQVVTVCLLALTTAPALATDQAFCPVGREMPDGSFCCGYCNKPCDARPDATEDRCRKGRILSDRTECDPNICAGFFPNQPFGQCLPVVDSSAVEIANGIDDNCDGQVIGDELCNGIDDDADGLVDEDPGSCLQRMLFVPYCWNSDEAGAQAAVERWVNFLEDRSMIDSCGWQSPLSPEVGDIPRRIWVDVQSPSTLGCPDNTHNTSLTRLIQEAGVDLRNYDILAFFKSSGPELTCTDSPGWTPFPGEGMVTLISPGATPYDDEFSTFAHEWGHAWLNLSEEYVSQGGFNPLSPTLGCDPNGDCCFDYESSCTGTTQSACHGNRSSNVDGWNWDRQPDGALRLAGPNGESFDPAITVPGFYPGTGEDGGRCLMSYVEAPGWDAGDPITGLGSHKGWCGFCLQRYAQAGPICEDIFPGAQRRLEASGFVTDDGQATIAIFAVSEGRVGPPPSSSPGAGSDGIVIEMRNSSGTLLESATAHGAASATLDSHAAGTVGTREFWLRAPVTQADEPVQLKTFVDGVARWQVTLGGSPPVANAGVDQTVECDQPGAGTTTLNGSASSDPDGDTISYAWSGGVFDASTIPMPTGAVPLGTHEFQLVVNDGLNASAADTVTVTVQDTLPPALSAPSEVTITACEAGLTEISLTPPEATEVCSPEQTVITGSVTQSNGQPLAVPVALTDGAAPTSVLTAGVHTVVWKATDGAGRSSTLTQIVTIEPCWPMFKRTAERRSSSPFAGPSTNNRLWKFAESPLNIRSSPAVAVDGTIYVGSSDDKLYAVNPDGTRKWATSVGGDIDSSPAIGFGGRIYVAADNDRLFALHPTTGAVICSAFLGDRDGESSPAIGVDGTVYTGSEDNRLYAIDGDTCAVRWRFSTGGDVDSSPAIDSAGTIYIGSDDEYLYAVNPNGAQVWRTRMGGDVNSTPALSASEAVVYVGSDDNQVYALATATGAEVWSTYIGSDVRSSPAVAPNGNIYVGADDGRLYALEPTQGNILWSRSLGVGIQSSPAVDANGTVFVGSDDDRVYAINGTSGVIVWSYKTGADVKSSPAIGADGVLYVGSDDDSLYAFGSAQMAGLSLQTERSVRPQELSSPKSGGCSVVGFRQDRRHDYTWAWFIAFAAVVLRRSRRV
jgi:outer membrane protein assembly factor BamB